MLHKYTLIALSLTTSTLSQIPSTIPPCGVSTQTPPPNHLRPLPNTPLHPPPSTHTSTHPTLTKSKANMPNQHDHPRNNHIRLRPRKHDLLLFRPTFQLRAEGLFEGGLWGCGRLGGFDV